MEKIIRIAVSVLLAVLIVVLAWKIVAGIQTPIDYEEQRTDRFQKTVDQLIAIRTAQKAYKENVKTMVMKTVYDEKGNVKVTPKGDTVKKAVFENAFTPSFDTLINFINNGRLKVVKSIGTLTDEQLKNKLTEEKAVQMIAKAKKTNNWKEVEAAGLMGFSRDTIEVSVKDSLFKDLPYPIEELRYTHVGRKVEFKMDTATVITGSGSAQKVFQCYALYDDLLDGLDRQLTVNYKDKIKDSCIRVGNLMEANNSAGNWTADMELKKNN
ncbi:MAG: hypothetical protein HUK15_05090 [Bacteroidales bacterium]|nr:hypothetical protein [Bacteroidales bacterium]